jgi:hypothetical protein
MSALGRNRKGVGYDRQRENAQDAALRTARPLLLGSSFSFCVFAQYFMLILRDDCEIKSEKNEYCLTY